MAGKPYKLIASVPGGGQGCELGVLLDVDGNITLANPRSLSSSYTWNTVEVGEVMDALRTAQCADRPVPEVNPADLTQANPNSATAPATGMFAAGAGI